MNPSWLKDAIFYEIYPQSFRDTPRDGVYDGIGDLNGIIEKLPYIQSLGCNAIWLNPCFESPFQDAGYDVSDYRKIAPRYGTNEDAKRLFAEARKLGIRILFDLVPGHTSIQHPWFKESCKPEPNAYSDYYVWTDSGWTWESTGLRLINGYADRSGSYVTNFFYSQPALNYGFASPDPHFPWQQPVDAPGPQAVRREIRDIMAFWLDMGCSGFRVDMAGSLVKKDNGWRETIKLWQEMRGWMEDAYPEAVLVSEWSNPRAAIEGGFHADFYIHFGTPGYQALFRKSTSHGPGTDPYGFSFFDSSGHGNIRGFLDDYLSHYTATKGKGYIALVTGNHDIAPRLANGRTPDDLELCFLFLMTMPGTPFIYYGDEIGMRSLEGLPSKECGFHRTASRTPMQWDDSPNAGFSTATAEQLYLPIDPDPARPTVAAQDSDPGSLLARVRRLTALRHAHPALQADGDFDVVYAEAGKLPFVYERNSGDERILVALNPGDRPAEVTLPSLGGKQPVTLYGCANAFTPADSGWKLILPGVSGGVYRIA